MSSRSSRGQILLIAAASMIVILAIAALVIDLGLSWMLRRQEQNAADPGAIAAARWLLNDDGEPSLDPDAMYGDACFYAQENGFFAADTDCADAIDLGQLQVHSPPISGPYAARGGFVQVIISQQHPSFFGRIFGPDFATVTTEAVAANTAGQSNSNSLVALRPDGCDTGMVQGTGGGSSALKVSIVPANDDAGVPYDGGFVYVNSACPSPWTSQLAFCGGGSGSLKVSGSNSGLTAPKIFTVGTCARNGSGATIDTDDADMVNQGSIPIGDPLAGLPRPRLGDFPNGKCPNGASTTPSTPSSISACLLKGTGGGATCPTVSGQPTCVLEPGVYYGGWDVGSKVKLQLKPGMYILAGGGIKLSGTDASIESVTNAAGTEPRVTIFSTDGPGCPSIPVQCQAEIRFQASQDFRAKATSTTSCQQILALTPPGPNSCPWRGILLWQDGEGSNPSAPVSLGGQSTTVLSGTLYAPHAKVDVSGGSDTTGCSGVSTLSCLSIQIISWEWKITGNATVTMPYDPRELYQLDQRGLVH